MFLCCSWIILEVIQHLGKQEIRIRNMTADGRWKSTLTQVQELWHCVGNTTWMLEIYLSHYWISEDILDFRILHCLGLQIPMTPPHIRFLHITYLSNQLQEEMIKPVFPLAPQGLDPRGLPC